MRVRTHRLNRACPPRRNRFDGTGQKSSPLVAIKPGDLGQSLGIVLGYRPGTVLTGQLFCREDAGFPTPNSRAGFLEGTLDGIGVDELGTLRLADRVERLAEVDEPFLLSAASHPEGWVIGTGNSGRVLLVTSEGEVQDSFLRGRTRNICGLGG